MALFKNMAITNKGMVLFTKAQAGEKIIFTKMRVGSGDIGSQNPAALNDLVEGKLDVPISSIAPNPELKSATVIGNITNTGLLEPVYICEIGIYATDPDEGEILYGYSNSGAFGDYYAPETQGPYSWQYQISVAIGNAANVTIELTELNFDYGLTNTNTTFMVLKGGNQKELNKDIDTKLKTQANSIVEANNKIVKIGEDLALVNEDIGTHLAEMTSLIKIKKDVNILASGWVDGTLVGGFWKYEMNDIDITLDTVVDVNIHLADLEKASDIKSSNLSEIGKVILYADSEVTEDILCDIKLIRQVI